MTAQYTSKHGVVSRRREELFMIFTDLSNFARMMPEDKKSMVNATYDNLTATVQGFTIGVRVTAREPYSRIEIQDSNAPFHFCIELHFDYAGADTSKTEFWIWVAADLNLMMKMMIGNKIKEAMDKLVDSLVDISEGRMPSGMDMSSFK